MPRIIGITFLELSTCQYRDYQDRYFMYVDRIQIASSLTDCQRKCDSEQSFHCKSVNFDPISRECSLSSEDSVSFSVLQSHLPAVSGSLDSSIAPFQQDSIFSEKGNCEQGECTNMFSVFWFTSFWQHSKRNLQPARHDVDTKLWQSLPRSCLHQKQPGSVLCQRYWTNPIASKCLPICALYFTLIFHLLKFAIPLNSRCGTHQEVIL